MPTKKRKKKTTTRKKPKSTTIPMKVLEKRLNRLHSIVKRRGGKVPS